MQNTAGSKAWPRRDVLWLVLREVVLCGAGVKRSTGVRQGEDESVGLGRRSGCEERGLLHGLGAHGPVDAPGTALACT